MSQVSFSENGKEIKNAYDSIISGESSFEWALYGYEDGSNEIELVDSGNGLEQLCDEFDEDEYQYAFARVTDPNSNLPRFVFISWCGESVPFTKKGMYNAFTNDVLRFFSGFHIHINARSKFDVDPDEIMKKVKSCSGANYSFHQKQEAKNKAFNNVEPKIELKAEENKTQACPSIAKKNPLNENYSNDFIKKNNTSNQNNSLETPSLSNENSSISGSSNNNGNITLKANPLNQSNPVDNDPSKQDNFSSSRRSSCDYNPLKPSSSRRSSNVGERKNGSVENIREAFEKINEAETETKENVTKVCSSSISSRINAFQNQIHEASENTREEQKIKKDLSSKNLKNWDQKINEHTKEQEPELKSIQKDESNKEPELILEPVQINDQAREPEPVPRSESNQEIQEGIIVKALYSYEAAEEGELSFDENEILTNIVEVPGEGWWSGNNSKGEYGMFPSNYVSTDLNAVADNEENFDKPSIEQSDSNITAKALYSYEAQDDSEISFDEGEVISGIILQDENWAIGFNQNLQQGMFPLNYVELNQ
ncbi:hypothetical protein BCR36DRAFT_348249 [Piromyces finnis]|uniref:Actin depolymerizing protein n=1 Tax=Piromyces finnis TaxID=1754191 RepID=A0A1Y1VEM4_9FUNG|nr:hypothetical protein BCR36DRAFT_348249 [Piromyces finnis]|eukprot:ORX54219.1 hypothetical protein BCR36DRAFT_348249 [Piromyces finnis]